MTIPAPPQQARIDALVRDALAEDHADADATTQSILTDRRRVSAKIVARQAGIVCGRPVVERVFAAFGTDFEVGGHDDADRVEADEVVWRLHGPAATLLAGERVALNFAQRLSGIATLTARYVAAVHGSGVAITDTRKTTPLLRDLEKYAVRCGGGVNHRMHLADMLLVKENHIAAAGSLLDAVRCARAAAGDRPVAVELTTLAELRAVLPTAPDRVLLDHWSVADVREAVRLRGDRERPQIEVSGNLDLDSVRKYAIPGVAFLSVGRLTHSAPAFDLSLLVEN